MEITNHCPIKKLSTSQTDIPYQTEEIYFHDISIDSLLSIISNKPLLSLQLASNVPIQHTNQKGEIITSNQLNISYTYNPIISANLEQEKEIEYQLRLLTHQLETLLAEKKVPRTKTIINKMLSNPSKTIFLRPITTAVRN